MLDIERQILELQRIREKIGLYKTLLVNVESELTAKTEEHKVLEANHAGLLKEFVAEITGFCNYKIDELGNGPKRPTAKIPIEPIMPEPLAIDLTKENPKVPPSNTDEPTDPLKFLLKWRHLEGKKVRFQTRNGEVTGTVRGMVTPYLKVETDTGHLANVSPREIQEI